MWAGLSVWVTKGEGGPVRLHEDGEVSRSSWRELLHLRHGGSGCRLKNTQGMFIEYTESQFILETKLEVFCQAIRTASLILASPSNDFSHHLEGK